MKSRRRGKAKDIKEEGVEIIDFKKDTLSGL